MDHTKDAQELLLMEVMEVLDHPVQDTSTNIPSSQCAKNGELYSNLTRASSDLELSASQIYGLPWEPGFFRQLPWSAFGALLLALAFILACIIIVVSSHGKVVETWPVRPSIWLALLTAAANACLRHAFVEGANIFWWNRAVQGGTIQELHRTWMSGTRLKSAITAGRRFDWLALASIVVAVVAIDGPLLQRASSTGIKVFDPQPAIVNVTVATEVPLGYSGFEILGGTGGIKSERQFLSPRFQQVMQAYSARSPISATDFSGCRGTCSGTIKAAGLYSECSQSEDEVTWIATGASNGSQVVVNPGSLFSINISWSEAGNIKRYFNKTITGAILPIPSDTVGSDEPFINLEVIYSKKSILPTSDCHADCPNNFALSGSHRIHQSCRLYAATKSYPIIIQPSFSTDSSSRESTDPTSGVNYFVTPNGSPVMVNGSLQNARKVIADSLPGQNLSELRLWNPIPYFVKDLASHAGKYTFPVFETLSGIASSAQNLLGTNVSFLRLDGAQVVIQFDGSPAMQFLRSDSPSLSGDDGWVGLTFNDPMAYLFSALDEIMLRVAIDAANLNTLELAQENLENPNRGLEGLNFTSFPKPQSVTMMETLTVQVYQSDYRYLAAALVVVFLTTFAIVPTFQGFWGLGRKTSLSPFETAKALGAPLLDDGMSNACAEELVKQVYPLPIQYGEVVDTGIGGNDGKRGVRRRMLRIAPSRDVVKPSRDTLYF